MSTETIIELYSSGFPFKSLLTDPRIKTFFDEVGSLRFSSSCGVLLDSVCSDRMDEIVDFADAASSDSGIIEYLSDFEGSLDELYDHLLENYSLVSEVMTGPARTARRPRKRRFSKLGAGFSALTGKRKDPMSRLKARRTARKFRAKRKFAQKKFSRSAKGKQFHRKLGKLVARIRRR